MKSGIRGGVKLSNYLLWPLQGTNQCDPNGPITLWPPNSSSVLEAPEWGTGSSHSTAFLARLGFHCKSHLALCARGNYKVGAQGNGKVAFLTPAPKILILKEIQHYPQNKDRIMLLQNLREHSEITITTPLSYQQRY